MSEELYQQILNYLNSFEVEKKLQDILNSNFDTGQKENFLKVWQKIKNLEFNIDDLYPFLVYFIDNDLEKVEKIDNELFENIFIEVYDELIFLYGENKKKPIEMPKIMAELEMGPEEIDQIPQSDLTQKYNAFSISSLFQNILAAEEMFSQKYLVNGILNSAGLKEEFYEALNGSDKIKVAGALRVLAGAGQLGVSFANDQRYLDFWGNFLERHYGLEIKQKFLQEPSNKKYFLEFLRFVLEKRLNFSTEESAMVGMGLAALCGEAGESALAEMAYGDEVHGHFVWNE